MKKQQKNKNKGLLLGALAAVAGAVWFWTKKKETEAGKTAAAENVMEMSGFYFE